jgi:integrase
MSAMLDELGPKGARSWDLLDALKEGRLSVGDLYDAWTIGPQGLDELRASLNDSDANDLIPGWLRSIRDHVALDTAQHYSTHVRTYIAAGIPFPVTRITRVEISKWLHSLECTTSTKRKYRAALSSFCNYLVELGHIQTNPVFQVKAPKAGKSRMRYLEHFQVIQLVESQPEPFRTISALMHATGMEISALLRVTRGEVDTKVWTVRAQGTKTSTRDRQAYRNLSTVLRHGCFEFTELGRRQCRVEVD